MSLSKDNQINRIHLRMGEDYISKAIQILEGIIDEETWQILEESMIAIQKKHQEYVDLMLSQ